MSVPEQKVTKRKMTEKEKNDERFSFSMTLDLKQKMIDTARAMSSPDHVIRPADVCRIALERFCNSPDTEQEFSQIEDFDILEVMAATAKRLGLTLGSLVTRILTENLGKYIEEANVRQRAIQKLRMQALPGKPQDEEEPAQ